MYHNITSGDEDRMAWNVFVLVSFNILCLDGIYFFMMPGGGSSERDGSAVSTSSEVSIYSGSGSRQFAAF